MKGAVVVMFSLFAVALSAPTMRVGIDGTLRKSQGVVDAREEPNNGFTAFCDKDISNVVVVCSNIDYNESEHKFDGLSGYEYSNSVPETCEISHVCVKCGNNKDTTGYCPDGAGNGCGECITVSTPTPTPTPTACPGVKTEICWAADLDTELGAEGWELIQRFIRKTIQAMDALFPDPDFVLDLGVLAGTATFDTATSTDVGQDIIDFFHSYDHVAEGSQLELALKRCRQLMSDPDRKNVVILITDGNGEELDGSDLAWYKVQKQAELLKDEGAEIFSVAIAADGNETRLRKLSGKNGSDVEHYHKIDKYVTNKSFDNYAKKLVACL